MIKNRPRRLDAIFIAQPLYFITFSTRNRKLIPALDQAADAVEIFGRRALDEYNIALGRYVIMPDHVHLFVRGNDDFVLSKWISMLKRAISARVAVDQLWQPGFFDHVLRSDESYSDKWNYVRDNPVRAGLVQESDDWPYQGEVVVIGSA